MAVIFDQVPVYGILGDGRLVQTSNYREDGTNKYYVGGKIFYIDETATGATYTFYNRNGAVITDVQVGDEPYAYSVTGTPSKEKYYVFNANAVTNKTWTYQSEGSWVTEYLGTTDTIGSGKTNTATVLAASSGVYCSANGTIWNAVTALNTAVDKGCNDWYVGSKAELEALKTATDREGNALTTLFSNTNIWSSSEDNANRAWAWIYNSQSWSYGFGKFSSSALIASRSF